MTPDAGTPPRFGAATLTFLVVADTVGAGVFTTSGCTLEALGSPTWVIVAWLLGGSIALAGAFSYGALVRAMPESGGEYVFLSRALHPVVGFVAGWVSLVAGFSGAIAFAASAFESYVLPVRPAWLPVDVVAVAVVIATGALHGLRGALGARLQNVAVALKLSLLVVVLGLAASVPAARWQGHAIDVVASTPWSWLAAMTGVLVWISLSYSGFNAAVYVAEESVDARATIPAALVRGTLVVTTLYVALNAVFVFAPPPDLVLGRADIAAVAASWIAGPPAERLVRVVIAVSLLTSISSMLMAAPRVYAKMAEDGLLPEWLRARRGAPAMAVATQVLLAVVLVMASSLRELLSYLGLTLSLSAACSVACLFLPSIRRRLGDQAIIVAPLVFVGATLLIAAVTAVRAPAQLVATAVTFATGAGAYLLIARTSRT